MSMFIVIGNYGDETIAVMQWIKQQGLAPVTVVSIDTGWAAPCWQTRVAAGEAFAKRCGFTPVRLQAKLNFADLVRERQHFPNQKYQWCPGFLKGLPLLQWLDDVDPSCEATIVLSKRRAASRAQANLPEYIAESEHHGQRRVWHPLYDIDNAARDALVTAAKFPLLHHRSLECDPCIHNSDADFLRMEPHSIAKIKSLETEVGEPMFVPANYAGAKGIVAVIEYIKQRQTKLNSSDNYQELFDKGCGSPFGCGQ